MANTSSQTSNLFHAKAALVTGASRGLGAALATQLAARGARVALAARGRQALESVTHAIREAGAEAHALVADIGKKEDIYPLAGAAAALLGPVDILIHNASILGPLPLRLLLDTECEDLSRVLEANLIGPFRLSRVIAGAMALRGSGLIVHISSDAALVGYERWGAYGISKAALDQLSRSWAQELAEYGVDVLSIDPGEMNTQMHRDAMPDADPAQLADPAQVAQAILEYLESRRWKSGDRIAIPAWRTT